MYCYINRHGDLVYDGYIVFRLPALFSVETDLEDLNNYIDNYTNNLSESNENYRINEIHQNQANSSESMKIHQNQMKIHQNQMKIY